jgi:hypothetical protein
MFGGDTSGNYMYANEKQQMFGGGGQDHDMEDDTPFYQQVQQRIRKISADEGNLSQDMMYAK